MGHYFNLIVGIAMLMLALTIAMQCAMIAKQREEAQQFSWQLVAQEGGARARNAFKTIKL
jgi:hypothetical protein